MNTLPVIKGKKHKILLALLSAVLLGVAFPPIPTGVTVFVAFIPFFLLLESLETYGETIRYSYFMLIIAHFIIGYWSGGYTELKDYYLLMGGTALLLINPFFYLIAILSFQFIRKQFSLGSAVLSFPFLWITIELFRANTELALPWITLGNTQTYNLPAIQFASFTGVYGISFWILTINVFLFFMYKKVSSLEWNIFSKRTAWAILGIAFIYMLPIIYGTVVLKDAEKPTGYPKIKVAMIQPNIDPFEKWEGSPYIPLALNQAMTRSISDEKPDLVIWSETAVPFFLLQENSRYYLEVLKQQLDSQQVVLLSGIPNIQYYGVGEKAPKSSKMTKEGLRYDSYNSSMLIRHNIDTIQTYAKMLLVPFAERVPYSEELSFLNAMQWNLGLGGWGIGKKQTVFHFKTNKGAEANVSSLICFESIFPAFVADFVKNGANFLTIITNDSWWGNTSGAYQHKQYAILRAVENRRWIARCASGGISCIIDPFGHILQSSKLYTKDIIIGDVELRNDKTFYTFHGDWFAEFCLLFAGMCVVSAIGKKYYTTIRKQQGNQNEIY